MKIMLGKYDVYLGSDDETPTAVLDLDDLLPITDDLNTEFMQQPSLYAYVAMLSARSEAEWQDAKRHLEKVYAATDKEVRLDLSMDGEKVTEGKVASEVKLRSGYIEAQEYELACNEQRLIMRAVESAMSMRAQMLISLGAHLRAEAQQVDMHINQAKETLHGKRRAPRANKSKPVVAETPPF